MTPSTTAGERRSRITRDDIEAKLTELAGEVESGREAARSLGLVAAAAGITILVVGAYLLGRRRGLKRRMVLEIRRL